ncbi:MATE family efflux transporter [Pendulispora brunnea]|uniref:MATE family efflux transporter n=2 Tax=Pendulispora brunnea TaxID=2905690 RepID=A0ABZ2JYR0_9BACT
MIGGFINNVMIARVDSTTFAAGLLVNSIQLTLGMVVFGLLYSLSALIGTVIGEAKNPERVGQLFIAGAVVSLALSIPSMAVLFWIEPLLRMLGQPAAMADLCARYFRLYVWAVPAMGIVSVYVQFLLGTFKQAIVFLYSIGSMVVSIALGYVMIFGKLGLPAMGIEGLAGAAVVTAWLAAAVLTYFILGRPEHRQYALLAFKARGLQSAIASTLRLGFPISVQSGNEICSFLITSIMVGWLGIEALSAQQVATRYVMMLVIPVIGLSQAASMVVSRSFGAKNLAEVKQYGGFYASMGVTYSLIVLAAFVLAPRIFIKVFLEDTPENAGLFETLPIILVWIAVGQVFDAIRNVVTGALRGLQDTKYPMNMAILAIWPIGIPLTYFMGFALHWGLVGITLARNVVMAIGCGVLLLRWRSKVAALGASA